MTEKLRRFYKQFEKTDQVLIAINADPDAIGSAMAVKRLLWRKVAGVTITHFNHIKRPDNLTLIRLVGLKLVHMDDIDLNKYKRFVIVDSQPNHHESLGRFSPDVVIDHHPLTDFRASYKDIRPDYGATASMMTEYIRAAGIKPSEKLATALFHAIKTDTSNFERKALVEDIKAFQFLFKHANIYLARKIEQADLRFDFLKYFRVGLENMRMRRNRVYVHIGEVSNGDICVIIAEFFMRIQSVQWSIVSGRYEDRLIIVFRNDGIRKSAGKLAQQAFGAYGSAGGHKSMARAELIKEKLPSFLNLDDEKQLMDWIIELVEKKTESHPVGFKKDLLGISKK